MIDPEVFFAENEKYNLRQQFELCSDKEICLIGRGLPLSLLKNVARKTDIPIFYLEGEVQLVLYLDYAENSVSYSFEMSDSSIIDFLAFYTSPTVIPLERKYLEPLFNEGGTAVVLLKDKKHRGYENEIKNIGSKIKKQAKLLIADVSEALGKQVQKVLKVPDRLLPCVRIIVCKGGSLNITQFHMFEEIATENIIGFFKR